MILQRLRYHLYYPGLMGAMRPVDLEDDTQLPTNLQGHTLWVDRAKDGVRGKQGSVRMLELEFEIELNI